MKKWFLVFVLLIFASASFAGSKKDAEKKMINLSGWKAKPAETNSVNMMGMKLMNIVREYKKGKKTFLVHLLGGNNPAAMAYEEPQGNESGNARLKKIKGFDVFQGRSEDEKENGAIVVYLEKNKENDTSVLTFSYENVTDREAMALAKKFDWKWFKTFLKEWK